MRSGFLCSIICAITIMSLGQGIQKGDPFVRNFRQVEYKAGTDNFVAAQDSEGTMFFGNGMGVLVFDGAFWELIPVDNHSYVRSLAIDKNDRVYVGAYQEFGFLELDADGFYRYHSLMSLIPDSSENFADIWKIIVQDDLVYFQSYYALLEYDGESIRLIRPETEFDFAFKVDSHMYIGEESVGLRKLEDTKLDLMINTDFFKDKEIVCMTNSPGKEILIGTRKNGVFRYDGEVRPWNKNSNLQFVENKLSCGSRINNDFIVFGTVQAGLFITNNDGEIVHHLGTKEELSDNLIQDLFVDRDQNIWTMTDLGIDYVEVSSQYSILATGIGSGYSSEISKDRLYLGTNRGLYQKKWKGESSNSSEAELVQGTVGQVWSVEKIQDFVLLGHHEGAFLIKDDHAEKISEINGHWQFIRLKDYPQYILSGTYTGYTLFKIINNNIEFVRKISGFNESCRVTYQSDDGYIWMSHGYKGIFRLKLNDRLDGFESIDFFTQENGLPTYLYNDIFKYQNEVYVVSPEHGIYMYNSTSKLMEKDEKLSSYFDFQNHPVTKIISGPDNRLYNFSHEHVGILTILNDTTYLNDLESLDFIADKLVTPFESVTWDEHLNMIIGTQYGFVHFTQHDNFGDQAKFMTFISRLYAVGEDAVMESSARTHILPLRIPYKNNLIRLSLAATYYCDIGSNKFRYNINGTGWSDWSSENQIELIKLKEGSYDLRVQSKNFRGEYGSMANVSFIVMPPWYRSIYAYVSYILITLVLVLSIYFYVKRRMQRITLAMNEEQKRKLKEQEEKNQLEKELAEKEMIKLRNEKLDNEVVHKSKELANTTQGIIHKNQVLNEIKADLKLMAEESQNVFVQRKIKGLLKKVDKNIDSDHSHDIFRDSFDRVHENFIRQIRSVHPDLTPKDLRLCSYLRMNLSTKEIAPLLNISVRGVEISRYRLRKKLQLDHNTNLTEYILNF